MLLKLIKPVIIGLAALLIGWAAVMLFWQSQARDPGAAEIIALLTLVPLALLGLWFLFTRGIEALGQASPASEISGGGVNDSLAEPYPRHRLWLLDWRVNLPIGDSCDESLEVLCAANQRPKLDDDLRDNDGFPIFASRCPALPQSIDGLAEHYSRLAHPLQCTGSDWRPAQLRALAIGEGLLEEMLHGFMSEPELGSLINAHAFQLVLGLPPSWTEAEREVVSNHLLAIIEQALGQSGVPRELHFFGNGTAQAALNFIDRCSLELSKSNTPHCCLLLAMDSAIDEQQITDWDSRGLLFHQANPRGRIPAEGAAAVLFANSEIADAISPEPPLLLLPAAVVPREDSAARSGPNKPSLLNDVSERAIQQGGCACEDVAMIVSDAGLQPGLAVESGMMVTALFPQLQDTAQSLHIGTACGDLGAAAPVASLAISAAASARENAPVLVVGLRDERSRSAVVIRPAAAAEIADADPEATDGRQTKQAAA